MPRIYRVKFRTGASTQVCRLRHNPERLPKEFTRSILYWKFGHEPGGPQERSRTPHPLRTSAWTFTCRSASATAAVSSYIARDVTVPTATA